MCKTLIYLISVALVLGLAGYASAAVDANIPSVATPPIIDGAMDAVWLTSAEHKCLNTDVGSAPVNSADLSVSWWALGDANNLYVFVDVNDCNLWNDSSSGWDDDSVEIFIDIGNDKQSTYGDDDFQYRASWNATGVRDLTCNHDPGAQVGVEFIVLTKGVGGGDGGRGTGYTLEIKFPWDTLDYLNRDMRLSTKMGFEVQVNDDDNGNTRERQVAWINSENVAWNDPNTFGTVQLGPGLKASNPTPRNKTTGVLSETIEWTAGKHAKSHDVYFGTDITPEFIRNQTETVYEHPAGLEPNTTYYWRIDEVNEDGPDPFFWGGDVWHFTTAPLKAYSPDPPNNAEWIDVNANLVWSSGWGAQSHDVYFGTDSNPSLVAAGWLTTTYDPGTLQLGTTYYWRINEFDGSNTHIGDVWNFTTPHRAEQSYPIDINNPQPILLGNWERSFDGWRIEMGDAMAGFSGTGATLDGPFGEPMALKMVGSVGNWVHRLQWKAEGPSNEDLNTWQGINLIPLLFPISGGVYGYSPWDKVQMDVTVLPGDWVEDDDPMTIPRIAMKCVLNTGGYDANWNWGGIWGDAGDVELTLGSTTHCVWDISAGIQQTVDIWNQCYTARDQYYELFLIPLNEGYVGKGTYYIDAVYLTPEQAYFPHGLRANWSYPIDINNPQPIALGNFERSFDGWRSGWGDEMWGFSFTGGTLDGPPGAYDIEGAPMALKLVVSGGSWGDAWQLKMQGPTNDEDLNTWQGKDLIPLLFPVDVYPSGTFGYSPWNKVQMDVTLSPGDWVEDDNTLTTPRIAMKCVLNTGGFDENQNRGDIWYDAGAVELTLGTTTHCVWDISAAMQATVDTVWDAGYNVQGLYYEIIFVLLNDGYVGTGTYYLDNMRLMPEPVPGPDLVVRAPDITFAPDSQVEPGTIVVVSAEVYNVGTADAGSFVVRFFNGDPESGGIQIGADQEITSLAGGASEIVSVAFDSSPEPQSYEIFVLADANSQVTEGYEANNKAFRTLKVGPDLDLTSSDISFSAEVAGEVRITAEVHNVGAGDITKNIEVDFYKGDPDAGGIFIDNATIPGGIPVGLSGIAEVEWPDPPLGTYNIYVVVDPKGTITEATKVNNKAFNILSATLDLTLTSEDISFNPEPVMIGQQMEISATIHNNGFLPSEAFVVKFYDGDPAAGGTELGTGIVDQIAGLDSVQVSILSTFTTVGKHEIYVLADAVNQVTETNEDNNLASKSLYVQYATIQETINAASPGDTLYIGPGTYNENVLINKPITLIGAGTAATIIDGGGTGDVVLVTADNVTIKGFTVQNSIGGGSGIHLQAGGARVSGNVITQCYYGVFCDHSSNSYIAYNKVNANSYGIYCEYASDDAIRYNTITNNTLYGAKSHNSRLVNCFNWNYFRGNPIAYSYDPEEPVSPLLFANNVLQDNDIGIEVKDTSDPNLEFSENTIVGSDIGILCDNANPLIKDNALSSNKTAICLVNSSSPTIEENVISDNTIGILHDESSEPNLIDNNMTGNVWDDALFPSYCFPTDHPDFYEWLKVGNPDCWCYKRQCHGDVDNASEYVKGKGYYYVHFKDLSVLLIAWNVREPPEGPGVAWPDLNICADFDHHEEYIKGKGYYRAHFKDLGILLANWNVREPPHGPGIDPNCLDCP